MTLLRAGAVCAIVLAVLGHTLGGVARAQAPTVPLPSDLTIDAPAADVPGNVSRFAGAWAHGAWDGVLPHALVVEAVDGTGRAQVVYALGDSAEALPFVPRLRRFVPGWRPLVGLSRRSRGGA